MARAIAPEQARRIRLVLLDVDGVLTDNGVYIGATESGEAVELKRFHVRDGLGIKLLTWAGLEVALVSGRVSTGTALRAAELGIACHQDRGGYKLATVERLLAERGLSWGEVAFMGDDLADLVVLARAGLPVAVADAVPEVKALAAWVTDTVGGEGAVREFAEALLRARGEWSGLLEDYRRVREGAPGVNGGRTSGNAQEQGPETGSNRGIRG
jgi:3-deoxy-D-manno-octulosonate 8-phosphate phosphatase (KDO 8-P phosphatase)